jgi:excisionase family DNA binding protein
MTVCIAALCEERKALVVAADRMVRSARCRTEAEFHKISRLHKDWWLMLAGDDVGPAFDIPHAATGRERASIMHDRASVQAAALITSENGPAFQSLISSTQAAKLLGNLLVKTLQRYARSGRLLGYQIGRHWYFRESEPDAWLRLQLNSKCQSVR